MPVRVGDPGATRIVDPTSQANRTATHLSTNIVILVRGISIAGIQSLSITEQRQLKAVDEVGTDGHIDMVPQSSTNITGNAQRIRFAGQRVAEAFLRDFVHVHSQRIPFDIEIQDKFRGDGDNIIITTVRNVWIERIEYNYQASDFTIMDTMGWQAESIDSTLAAAPGTAVVGNPNFIGVPMEGNLAINEFERTADVGNFRGALDAPGLLQAFDAAGGRTL